MVLFPWGKSICTEGVLFHVAQAAVVSKLTRIAVLAPLTKTIPGRAFDPLAYRHCIEY